MTIIKTYHKFVQFLTRMDLVGVYIPGHGGTYEIFFGKSFGELFGARLNYISADVVWYRFDDERERELVTAVNLKTLFS